MKHKVGSIVVLTTKRGRHWNSEGRMDEYCGAIVQLMAINSDHNIHFAEYDTWRFEQSDILRAATADEIAAYMKGIRNIKELQPQPLPIFN